MQQFGNTVWDAATGPHTIAFDDTTVGIAEGQQQLDNGFYSSRLERSTRAEREFLRAIGKGIVYSPEHGTIAYTVPGMADDVARRHDE